MPSLQSLKGGRDPSTVFLLKVPCLLMQVFFPLSPLEGVGALHNVGPETL